MQSQEKGSSQKPSGSRTLGGLALAMVVLYTAAVLSGLLKTDRRIDATTLGVIAVGTIVAAVLLRPDIVERVTRLEAAGVIIEIEKKQQQQDKQLQDIELFLAILLTDDEQKYLLNLDSGNTAGCRGSHELRKSLRGLAEKHLIRRRTGRNIGDILDQATIDLADFVKFTEIGQRLVERVKQVNAEREAEKTRVMAQGK